MNDDTRIGELHGKMLSILFTNKWTITVTLFDGSSFTGRLKGQNMKSEPFQVTITLTLSNSSEVTIDMKYVKDITP